MLRNPRTEVHGKAPAIAASYAIPSLRVRLVPYVLYSLIVAALWAPYSDQLNADGVSYLSIAAEYARRNWWTALNTYWSPLFSWLLAPALALHAPPILFARLLLALVGLLALIGLQWLLSIFHLQRAIRTCAMLTAVPMLCYFAIYNVTPDLIVVLLLMVYLRITCARELNPIQWRCAGALGALLYFAKAYCFAFAIAHLFVICAIRIYAAQSGTQRARLLKRCASAIAIMVVLCTPWLVLVGTKAGRPTLSTAGSYNFKLALIGKSGHPMLSKGLFAPANPDAVSIWENPDAMPLQVPSASSSLELWQREAAVIARNLLDFARYELWASVFAPFIVVTFAYICFERWRAGTPEIPALCVLATYLIYPAAYFLTFVEHRYIWIEDVLTLVMAAYIFEWLLKTKWLSRTRLRWMGALAAVSFCCAPLLVIVRHRNDLHAIADLLPALRQLHLKGNMVSNARWDDTQYLAYRLGLRYYGMPAQGSAAGNEQEMKRNRVRYVFVWPRSGAPLPARPGAALFSSKLLEVYGLSSN